MAKEKQLKSKGDGHSDEAISGEQLKKLDAWLDLGTFDNVFTTPHIASAIEKFVERGEKVEDLLLRGHFRDADHMNALIRLYRKAVHFKDDELQALLLNHAAGYPAIGGLRIDILLRAVVGAYSRDKEKTLGHSLKNALGLTEKPKND